jgi:tRNA pseudouridine13 synthase
MSSLVIHEREQDDADLERYTKRSKVDADTKELQATATQNSYEEAEHILPPSHALLGIPLPVAKEGSALNILEKDVGISEYIGRGEAKVEGIIKQRLVCCYRLEEKKRINCSSGLLISWFMKLTWMGE